MGSPSDGEGNEVSNPRIYIAIGTFHPLVGGAERQALLQGQALRALGYDATIVTLRHDRAWPKHDVVEGVPVVRVAGMALGGREKLPTPLRRLAYLLGVFILGWALWWRRQRFDILHVYQLNLLILPAALVSGLVSKPLIVALRCADSHYQGVSSNRQLASSRPLQTPAQPSPAEGPDRSRGDLEALESLGKPMVLLTHYLLRRPLVVLVVLSARMRQDLLSHGFHFDGVQAIPNGVDLTRFRPARLESPIVRPTKLVIYVGRLTFQKGVDVLLTAWRGVQDRLPELQRARLVIVGAGPGRAQLECLTASLGIADSVMFVGEQSDVAAWLRTSDVAVLPSRWEGMSNALLEAMASGLPCVATRVSGSEEVIQHSVNGLLVEPEDHVALAGALSTLLLDPALGDRYGRAAHATVVERYSLDHVTSVYLELYHRLHNGAPRPISARAI
jgi:glycosyltransferase involved in cell wall biosynthesis